MRFLNKFAADEDGAVTVDWVVLTAAVALLGVIVTTAVAPSVNTELAAIATDIVSE